MQLPDDIALRFASHPMGEGLALDGLSQAERTRLEAFGSEKRRREFALGRMAARSLLAEHLGVRSPDVPLRVGEDGAPEVEGTKLHISISHVATEQRTLAVAVAAPYRLGVDLELIRPRRPDLYRFLLDPEEYGLLETLPYTHDETQVLIWTLKESVLKALRTGFRLSPKRLRLAIVPEKESASVVLEDGDRWEIQYTRWDECFLAVSFINDDRTDSVH